MKRAFIILMIVFLTGCNTRSKKVIASVLKNYKDFEHQIEYFQSDDYRTPHLILYRGEMERSEYDNIIKNPDYVPNCIEFHGFGYDNMKENSYPFDLSEVVWWQSVYNLEPDFVGHYSKEMNKFTDCKTSREYKYAYKFLDGYCYLIIENTLQIRKK